MIGLLEGNSYAIREVITETVVTGEVQYVEIDIHVR